MKNRWIIGILFVVLGAIIAVGPHTFFHACEGLLADGRPMKCHWTAMSSTGIGTSIALIGIISIMFKQEQIRMAFSIANAVLGALVIAFATALIGVCPTVSMPCHMLTRPILCVISSILIIISLANVLYLSRKDSEKHEQIKTVNNI